MLASYLNKTSHVHALVLLIGGQLFLLGWILPVLYWVYRSIVPATTTKK